MRTHQLDIETKKRIVYIEDIEDNGYFHLGRYYGREILPPNDVDEITNDDSELSD